MGILNRAFVVHVGDRFKIKGEEGPCTVTQIIRPCLGQRYVISDTRNDGDYIKVEHDVINGHKCGTDGWYEYAIFKKIAKAV